MSQAGPWSSINVERPWSTEPDSARESLFIWAFQRPKELPTLGIEACPLRLNLTSDTLTVEGDVEAVKAFSRGSDAIRVVLASYASRSGRLERMTLHYSPNTALFWVESQITGAAAPRLSYRTAGGTWAPLELGKRYRAAGDLDVRADTVTSASYLTAASIQQGGRRLFMHTAQQP